MRFATFSTSARAVSKVAPSRSRPNANQVSRSSRFRTLAVRSKGTYRSTVCGNENPCGMIPTKVVGVPFIRTTRQTTTGLSRMHNSDHDSSRVCPYCRKSTEVSGGEGQLVSRYYAPRKAILLRLPFRGIRVRLQGLDELQANRPSLARGHGELRWGSGR